MVIVAGLADLALLCGRTGGGSWVEVTGEGGTWLSFGIV